MKNTSIDSLLNWANSRIEELELADDYGETGGYIACRCTEELNNDPDGDLICIATEAWIERFEVTDKTKSEIEKYLQSLIE